MKVTAMSEGSSLHMRVQRSLVTRYPLNEVDVSIYSMPNGSEVIPYVALTEAMERPPHLPLDRLAAACAPYLRKHESSNGVITSLVQLRDLSAVLQRLGDAYPLAQHHAILNQFNAASAPIKTEVEAFDEDDPDDDDDEGDDAPSPLVVEVDPTATPDTQALQEELNEAAIAENLIWAALVGQRAKRRRLQRRLGIK